MDWQDDVDEEERGLDKAFTLIREAPPALPPKASSKASKASKAPSAAHTTRDLQLGAFHELFKGEPQEQRLARAAAAQRCWAHLAGSIQVQEAPPGFLFMSLAAADVAVPMLLLSPATGRRHCPDAPTARCALGPWQITNVAPMACPLPLAACRRRWRVLTPPCSRRC